MERRTSPWDYHPKAMCTLRSPEWAGEVRMEGHFLSGCVRGVMRYAYFLVHSRMGGRGFKSRAKQVPYSVDLLSADQTT
jgi:hypothetical protein